MNESPGAAALTRENPPMNSYPGSWPSRFLGPAPKLKDLSFLVWGLLFVGFILPFSIVIFTSHRPPDADFAGFYSLARILNEHSPRELYDFQLQKRICEEVHARKGGYGPLPYPPFVGLVFRPFTLLPYWAAYMLWVVVSLVLYGVGLQLLVARFYPQQGFARSLLFALACSYFPFIGYTVGNGQLTAVGFFALVLVLREDDLDHPMRSGLALCLCLYKPTLLLLILPMLLVTRRFKALLGFAAGTLAVVLVTSTFEGFAVWPDFLHALRTFGNSSIGVANHSFLPLAKYVDLTSFSSNVHGGRSWLGVALFLFSGCVAFGVLLRFWWKARSWDRNCRTLLWATTLTWTLLLNVYVPIYDSILIVLSLVMTAGALCNVAAGAAVRRWFTVLWILILICSWFSVPLSGITGIQILTLLFAGIGILQFMLLKHMEHQPVSGSTSVHFRSDGNPT
jgi:Glycosyltransferase family 87